MRERLLWGGRNEAKFQKAKKLCGGHQPMMADAEVGLMHRLLRPTDRMLEWGAGRSSCIWSRMVKELHSVEDSKTWVRVLEGEGLQENQHLHHVRREHAHAAAQHRPPSSMSWYGDYVHEGARAAANGGKFDVVLVDGRARPQCAFQALSLLAPGGFAMIHDWGQEFPHRGYYEIVLRWYDLVHREGTLAVLTPKDNVGDPPYAGELPEWWWVQLPVERWDIRRDRADKQGGK